MIRRILIGVASIALPAAIIAQDAPDPATAAAGAAADRAIGEGRYLRAARLLKPVAFDAAGRPRIGFAYQQWAETELLMTTERPRPSTAADTPLDPADARALAAATTRDAIAEIVARARRTRVVILNEDHGEPRHRAFGLEVARALRPLGYDVIALETLANNPDRTIAAADMAALQRDGYPRLRTGAYTVDPVFGDFLRQALALGYRPYAYETTEDRSGRDWHETIAIREQSQADHLRDLLADPNARVLVYVGFDHAAEVPIVGGEGEKLTWMAARLKSMTGIDPLTIDQATLTENPSHVSRAGWRAVAGKARTRTAAVFAGDRPLVVGHYAGAIELQVVHPPRTWHDGRPIWLRTMARRRGTIPAALLPRTGTRLVQAFVADEATDAVPVDQVLVTAGKPAPMLMLPRAKVRYAVQDDR